MMFLVLVGIGLGLILAAGVLALLIKTIWHTYHGNIVELIIKIVLSVAAVGFAVFVAGLLLTLLL